MRPPKYILSLAKPAALLLSSYGALWAASEMYAASLPVKTEDKLAILIAQPIRGYDYLRRIPGATDIYIHRVEQALTYPKLRT